MLRKSHFVQTNFGYTTYFQNQNYHIVAENKPEQKTFKILPNDSNACLKKQHTPLVP